MDHNILQKYIEGNATQQEKEDIAKWLDADEKHMQEFLSLRYIYDATLWHDENSISLNEEYTQTLSHTSKRRKLVRELLKVAAVFVLGLGCYHLFLSSEFGSSSNVALQSVYSPEGQRTEVILSDGTKVWLNAKSSLTFPDKFADNSRTVKLDGEAYFDVSHDAEKKFIVSTDLYDIKVHGTEFNVRAYSNNKDFETALIEGSIELLSTETDESMMLVPNNRVYLENNELVVTELGSMDQFLWKKGILYFENMKVKDLFEKLELYYDVKIVVENQEVLQHQYTGKFWTKDGIDHLLKVLQLRHNFKYKKSNTSAKDNVNTIIIY